MQFVKKEKIMPQYIDRSIENLLYIENSQSANYEVTQLINSLLGLLILPNEERYVKIENSDISSATLSYIQQKTTLCLDKNMQKEDNSLKNIVRHLRNSACHFRIKFCGNNEIEKIRFQDFDKDKITKKSTKNFEAELDIKLLRAFVVEFGKSMRDKYTPKKWGDSVDREQIKICRDGAYQFLDLAKKGCTDTNEYMLYMYAVTANVVFSCELSLKSILFDSGIQKNIKTHEIKKLFNLLPENIKGEIRKQYSGKEKLDKLLSEINNQFVDCRYAFEKPFLKTTRMMNIWQAIY